MNKDIERKLYFAKRILETIRMVDEPKLCYSEEKTVVVEALRRYISYLESETYDIGNR